MGNQDADLVINPKDSVLLGIFNDRDFFCYSGGAWGCTHQCLKNLMMTDEADFDKPKTQ